MARGATLEASGADARVYSRVKGPFDGSRIGLLDTPVSIYDLCEGGCFVTCPHPQPKGSEVELRIDLSDEGWITAKGRTVRDFTGFGFALNFVEISADDRTRLERSLTKLRRASECREEPGT
jgi:hypothetical protein